jgi:hypothetical protein
MNPIKKLWTAWGNMLEQIRIELDREDETTWQQRQTTGRNIPPDTTFDGKWQAQSEAEWNAKHQSWGDWWTNGPRS